MQKPSVVTKAIETILNYHNEKQVIEN
jgi:hypothetical protein